MKAQTLSYFAECMPCTNENCTIGGTCVHSVGVSVSKDDANFDGRKLPGKRVILLLSVIDNEIEYRIC